MRSWRLTSNITIRPTRGVLHGEQEAGALDAGYLKCAFLHTRYSDTPPHVRIITGHRW